MSVKSYRIQVRLHTILHDYRALSYVFIKPEYHVIQDLMNHIANVFGVDNFSLYMNGFYLPPTEDISLIEPNEQVLVISNIHPLQTIPQHSTPKVNEVSQLVELTTKSKKKRKLASADCNSIIDNAEDANPATNKKQKFEPAATSTTRKVDIVESRIQYYNNLSSHTADDTHHENDKILNLPPEELLQIKQNKEEVQKKLEKQFNSEELITPQPGSKNSSKKKHRKSYPEIENFNLEELQHNDKNAGEELACHNQTNVIKNSTPYTQNTPRLIQHVTPSRNTLPSKVIPNKINVIKNIVIKIDDNPTIECDKQESGIIAEIGESAKIDNNEQDDANEDSVEIHPLAVATSQSFQMTNKQEELALLSGKSSVKATPVNALKLPELSHPDDAAMNNEAVETAKIIIEETPQKPIDQNAAEPVKGTGSAATSSITYFITSLREDSAVVSKAGDADDTSSKFVTRRKRIRRRKAKVKFVHQDTPIRPPSLSRFMMPNTETKPLVHKFFCDADEIEDGEVSMEGDFEKMADSQQSICQNKTLNADIVNATIETSKVEDEIVDHTMLNSENSQLIGTEINKDDISINADKEKPIKLNGSRVHNDCNGRMLSKEVIEKLLPLKQNFPNINDMIVFQMLKIGDEFTPELSKPIVGKVISFCPKDQEIQLLITDGLSEFQQPQGSLLNLFVEDDSQPASLQVLDWKNLINPRLLGP